MGTSRRPLALGIVTVALVCGVAAIAANFGILSQTRDTPLGRLLPPVSVAAVPEQGAVTPLRAPEVHSSTSSVPRSVNHGTPDEKSDRQHDS